MNFVHYTRLIARPDLAHCDFVMSLHTVTRHIALCADRGVTALMPSASLHAFNHYAAGVDGTTLALASLLLQPQLAAWADEAAVEAVTSSASEVQAAAADAAQQSVEAPAWLGYVLLLSPILLYGIFNLYRSQVNPR
jgi:hypothetical protein